MAPHNVCGPVGTMANLHFAVATPNYKVLEHFNDFADAGCTSSSITRRASIRRDGCFAAPDRPGLGLKLNHDACREASAHGRAHPAVRGGLGKQAGLTLTVTPELVLDARAELGEGPHLGRPTARACSSSTSCAATSTSSIPSTGRDRIVDVGPARGRRRADRREATGIVGAPTGSFASIPSTGATTLIAHVEADLPDNRMNDGYVDARGRFWAGTMGMGGVRGARLALSTRSGRHGHTRMLTGVSISNGLDWSPGRPHVLLHRHWHSAASIVFDFDEVHRHDQQPPSVRRRFPRTTDYPDGLIVDADGFVWVALWEGGAVQRYAPGRAARSDQCRCRPRSTTKCAFGGPDLSDLYITTAWIGLDETGARAQPLAGGLFRMRPGVRGRPATRFARLIR